MYSVCHDSVDSIGSRQLDHVSIDIGPRRSYNHRVKELKSKFIYYMAFQNSLF